MSSGLTILIATSTAVVVLVVALVLARLVRMVVEASDRGSRTPRFVGEQRVRPRRVEPARRPSDERAGLSREKPTVPVGKEQPRSAGRPAVAASEEPAGPAPGGGPPASPARLVAANVQTEGGIDVKFRQSRFERSEARMGEETKLTAGQEATVDPSRSAYREVGDEVAAVLAAAEHGAAQILSKAEEQARRIRAEAEEKGRELEVEASRRRDALMKGVEGMEARIDSMLTAFRGMVGELDQLLPAERRSGWADKPESFETERLDEALKPASHRQLSSHTD
jgi:hypothetical protein